MCQDRLSLIQQALEKNSYAYQHSQKVNATLFKDIKGSWYFLMSWILQFCADVML